MTSGYLTRHNKFAVLFAVPMTVMLYVGKDMVLARSSVGIIPCPTLENGPWENAMAR